MENRGWHRGVCFSKKTVMARIILLLPLVRVVLDERKALVEVVLSRKGDAKKKEQLSTAALLLDGPAPRA